MRSGLNSGRWSNPKGRFLKPLRHNVLLNSCIQRYIRKILGVWEVFLAFLFWGWLILKRGVGDLKTHQEAKLVKNCLRKYIGELRRLTSQSFPARFQVKHLSDIRYIPFSAKQAPNSTRLMISSANQNRNLLDSHLLFRISIKLLHKMFWSSIC